MYDPSKLRQDITFATSMRALKFHLPTCDYEHHWQTGMKIKEFQS